MFVSYAEYLQHYGVKGMRWGVKTPEVDVSGGSNEEPPKTKEGRQVDSLQNKLSNDENLTPDEEAFLKDVIAGKYGNGEARKKALGADYTDIQSFVNKLVLGKRVPPKAAKKMSAGKGIAALSRNRKVVPAKIDKGKKALEKSRSKAKAKPSRTQGTTYTTRGNQQAV